MITPQVPLKELQADSYLAIDKVNSMTEEQCRYALVAVLILLFGSPESNADAVIHSYELPSRRYMAEAHLLLMQIGTGLSMADEVSRAEEEFARKFC